MRKKYASKSVQEIMSAKPGKVDLSKYEEATADDLDQAKVVKKVGNELTKAAKKHEVKYAKPKKHELIEFDGEVPSKIKVKASQVEKIVPPSVLNTGPFKFEPLTFNCHSDRLNSKEVKAQSQVTSLEKFLNNPTLPMIYGVGGTPDDSQARYFAAFLVAHHLRELQLKANVVWEVLYGGFDNPLLEKYAGNNSLRIRKEPTMIVLTNLTADSSNTKLEKAKDILERFPDIPRIVVNAGEDPMSFVSTRLHSPIHGLAYFSSQHYRYKVSTTDIS